MTPPRRRGEAAPAPPSRSYEEEAWAAGCRHVAGVDEAGRGALAGPVVAAAVILPPGADIPGVADSKLLTPARREKLLDEVIAAAVAWAVGIVEPAEIDELNILRATHAAMHRALRALEPPPDLILVDGWALPGSEIPQRNLIGGDRLCYAIAAASIIAKVTRDRLMRDLDAVHPEYGFAGHKGYGAATHLQALAQHGPCAQHRLSFAPCRPSGQTTLFAAEDAGKED